MYLRERLRVDAGGDHEPGVGVPRLVQARPLPEPCRTPGAVRAPVERRRVKRLDLVPAERDAVPGALGASSRRSSRSSRRRIRHRHRAHRGPRLRGDRAGLRIPRLADRDGAGDEVDRVPAARPQLAVPKAGVQRRCHTAWSALGDPGGREQLAARLRATISTSRGRSRQLQVCVGLTSSPPRTSPGGRSLQRLDRVAEGAIGTPRSKPRTLEDAAGSRSALSPPQHQDPRLQAWRRRAAWPCRRRVDRFRPRLSPHRRPGRGRPRRSVCGWPAEPRVDLPLRSARQDPRLRRAPVRCAPVARLAAEYEPRSLVPAEQSQPRPPSTARSDLVHDQPPRPSVAAAEPKQVGPERRDVIPPSQAPRLPIGSSRCPPRAAGRSR